MGFNAVWFARAAACALLALLVGFVGSLYLGAKLLGPVDETTKLEARNNQSIAAQVKPFSPSEGANAQPQDNAASRSTSVAAHPPTPALAEPKPESHPAAKREVTGPAAKQASSGSAGNQEELRLGQQERRRLRAERRTSLENANASLHRDTKKPSREDTRDEPFFPFRF